MTNSNSDSETGAAGSEFASMRDDIKHTHKKKTALPPLLDQVMREVVPDAANGAGGATVRLDRRLNILEKAFGDIIERHETSMRDRAGALSSVEDSVIGLRHRLEQAEKRNADAMMELRTALANVCVRLNGLEMAIATEPKSGETFAEPQAPDEILPDETADKPMYAFAASEAFEAVLDVPEPVEVDIVAPEPESYLSVARRAANAAMKQKEEATGFRHQSLRRSSRMRLLLFACAAPLTIVAAGTFVLNRHLVTAEPAATRVVLAAPSSEAATVTMPAPTEAKISPPSEPAPVEVASVAPVGAKDKVVDDADANAERDIGLKHLTGAGVPVDEQEAARWLLRAAYKGDPTAQYWLGTLYARGRGVPSDAFQASHWYETAAKKGNRSAMHNFAIANVDGRGTEKNIVEAARWFSKAAELGHVDSQFNLAVLYERGAGLPQSLTDAYKWYAIAGGLGDKEAAARIAILAKQLSPEDLAAAKSAAASFKPAPMDQSANAGNGFSQPPG